MRQSWSDTFHALGSAVLGLLKAELEALEGELARSGKSLGLGLGLLAAAGAFGFWTLGLATYFLIHLLAIWLQLWAASLVVTLAFAVIVAGLAFAGLRKLRRFENPVTTVRRRVEDHVDWWHDRVLGPDDGPPGTTRGVVGERMPVGSRHGLPSERGPGRDRRGEEGGATP